MDITLEKTTDIKQDLHATALGKLQNGTATICVIGLGYVGLPLVFALHKQYRTIGFDLDKEKIAKLKSGISYIKLFSDADVATLSKSNKFNATDDTKDLASADVILICVPTPLTKNKEPDMSYITATAKNIAANLKPGQLIILESTTYPGTSKELLQPILETTGLNADEDFFLAYSPEREDPGNKNHSASKLPKVVGANNQKTLQLATALYSKIVPQVVPVSSTDTAEAVKLMENIFRCANIALVNELKVVFSKMGINIWEVIEAAKTKPFGFMPFYPGPGLGGHCIPIDPFYLSWKAKEYDIATRFVELSGQINIGMPFYVIEQLRDALDTRQQKVLTGAKILLIGMAYKKNVDDIRESPSLTIFDFLLKKKALVDYFDPYIKQIPETREFPQLANITSIPGLQKNILQAYDAVIICTDHDNVNYFSIVQYSKLIVDTRNATSHLKLKENCELKNVVYA